MSIKCYNCGAKLSEYSFCTNCGVDVVRYKKIIRTSNYFYNQGLEKAQVRDLSGAVVSLRESLKFNKYNIKARNLLGLVYYETGEVAAALSEWIISSNFKQKKNMATEYIEKVRSNPAKLDVMKNAVKNYNKSLELCHQPDGNGIDLATIQLKKVVSQYPNFVRAHQLLGLCYLASNKPEYARRTLEKCRAIDVNNTLTLHYLEEAARMLAPADGKKGKKDQKEEAAAETYYDGNEVNIRPVGFKERKGSGVVLNIVLGIAIGLAIGFFLVLPAQIQKERAKSQESAKTLATQIEAKNITIKELEQTNSDQTAKIASLTESLNAYAGTEGTLFAMENLLKASSLYLSDPESYLEVADYITEVDEENWTDDTSENYKALYYALKTAIGPRVCEAYYLDGYNAYMNKEYSDAIAYLESAVFFDSTQINALYYLGLSYEAAEKPSDAKLAYNKLIELFPDSWQAARAQKNLDKLQ